MSRLFTNISQLVTPTGAGPKRGQEHSQLTTISDAALLVGPAGLIEWLGPAAQAPQAETIDLNGRAVLPGLVDPHTHAVWAGERLADFEARASGTAYEEILRRGGGIRSTMRATQAASQAELVEAALPRLARLTASGATTIEVKSGYGFTAEAELRMLEAIRELRQLLPVRLVATLLIHVPPAAPGEREAYVDMVVSELIPEAARRGLATAVDVFTEAESFTVAETRRMLEAARERGLKTKLHADQFHAIGGTELAVELGALSVDHLEASGQAQLDALAGSGTVGTVLPGVTLHLGLHAAPGRALIDAGGSVAVGTDLNPGSSPVPSAALVQALAVRLNGLKPAEALSAGTVNAAAALGLDGPGRLEVGCPADFIVLSSGDWRELSYDLSGGAVKSVWVGGHRVETQQWLN